MRTHIIVFLVSMALAGFGQDRNGLDTTTQGARASQPRKIIIGPIELHYIEEGRGEPLILLHGGQGDYRSWSQQIKTFAATFRVISYSRRYHYPNANKLVSTDHSALTDAADLAGLMAALNLGPVHLVGTSYGAFTALAFAIDHPTKVRSMVLAEPPVLQWANRTPEGAKRYRDFMETVHQPAGRSFAAGDSVGALRILINRFDGPGAFDLLPAERRRIILQNAGFFRAVTASSNPFPNLSRKKVHGLQIPVLVVRGAKTDALDSLVSEELIHTIPGAERAVIPNAGHGSPRQNPDGFNAAVLAFLQKQQKVFRKRKE